MPRGRRRRDAGAALVTTILAAALLLLIASIASQQAVVSFLIGHRLRESAEALVAAETAMSAALADLAQQPSFERLAEAEGGSFPFTTGAPPLPMPPSFTVDTEVRARSAHRLDIVATSSGRNRARRVVAATVERDDRPFVPATVFLAASTPSVSFTGPLRITGAATRSVAAVATAGLGDAESLERHLIDGGATVEGAVAATSWTGLGDVARRVRDVAAALPEPPVDVADGIWISPRSLDIGSATGAGVWLVDGDLTVRTSLDFTGLLLVLGDVYFADDAAVTVTGAMAQGDPGRSIVSRGDVYLAYDDDALRAVDAAHPGLLGHRARVIGWRDEAP